MNELLAPALRTDLAGWQPVLFSILLAFALSQAVAAVYVWTFRGLSYSRGFVQTLALVSIVVCSLMLAIGNNLAAGIGVAGGLSIVRFRTSLRDPRDIVFVFASLAAGISTGLQAHAAAVTGTIAFLGAALLLHFSSFGARKSFDGLVRFYAPSGQEEAIAKILRAHTQRFVLVTLRAAAQGNVMEHAYQISIPELPARARLVRALQELEGVQDVSLLLQEPTLEL